MSPTPIPEHTQLLQHGDLGLIFYFILALLGLGLTGLGSVWLMLRMRDKSHEKQIGQILTLATSQVEHMMAAHAEERTLTNAGNQTALKELRQDMRTSSARLDRLAEALFTLTKKIEDI